MLDLLANDKLQYFAQPCPITVNYFLETWLKFPNNLTWLKVGYEETAGLYSMSGHY